MHYMYTPEKRAGTDENGNNALHLATMDGKVKVMRHLMQTYPQLINETNNSNYAPLHVAARHNQAEAIKVLVNEGRYRVDATANDETALHKAAKFGNTEAVAALIECNAKVNERTDYDEGDCYTPLQFAVNNGHIQTARVLLLIGNADPDINSLHGVTTLQLAGQNEAMITLIKEASAARAHSAKP